MVKITVELDNIRYEECININEIVELSVGINGKIYTVISKPTVAERLTRRKERVKPLINSK